MSFASILDRAARRSTPEMRERIAMLRSGTPEAIAAIARSVHGIDSATWACSCGAAYAYPHSVCQSCRVPYPRVCISSGCGNVTASREGRAPSSWCEDCETDQGRQSRANSFARSPIPSRAKDAAVQFRTLDHHREVTAWVKSWLSVGAQSLPWRRERYDRRLMAPCGLYLAGEAGTGKTSIAARVVKRAFVDFALVDSFRWHDAQTLQDAFMAQYQGDDDDKARAAGDWRAMCDCPLLVLDDLFAKTFSQAYGEAVGAMIRHRMDECLATVVTSNAAPQWSQHFDDPAGRIASRWEGYGKVFMLRGPDVRVQDANEQAKARAA